MSKGYWEPFDIERKKVKTAKDHSCYFTGTKIFKGSNVEAHEMNVPLEGSKRTKTTVYMCGTCTECKHVKSVRG